MGPVVPAEPLFREDFETAGMTRWTSSTLMSVDGDARLQGSFGARATSTGADAFARTSLGRDHPELYSSTWVKVVSQGPKQVFLIKVRTAGGRSLAGLYSSNKGMLGYKNEVGGTRVTTSRPIADGRWHRLELRTSVTSAGSVVDVWLDGVAVPELHRLETLGSTGVGTVQIGESTALGAFDVTFDDVVVDVQRR